jgi:PAS domain S-box-containing protein
MKSKPLSIICCRLCHLLFLTCLFISSNPVSATNSPLLSAAEPFYPPLSFAGAQGQAEGFSVELLRAAVQAMNQEVLFQTRPWEEIKQELSEGKLDVLPLVGRTPEREAEFDFTVPYLRLHGTIVVRKDAKGIYTAEDLRGKRVGVMSGDNAEEYMLRERIAGELVSTQTYKQALQKLASGELHAVVVQRLVALRLIEELGLDQLTTLGKLPDFRQDFCFAVTEGNKVLLAQLNEGLAVVIADGTYNRLREKWLGVLEEDHTAKYLYTAVISVIITLLIAMSIAHFWQQSLRLQVRSRTAELQQKNIDLQKSEEELRKSEQALMRAHNDLEKRVQERTEDLQKEKQFSDITITSLPGIFYLFNQDGKFLRWNSNFEAVSRYSGEEISQMRFLEFFHTVEQSIIGDIVNEVFSKGHAFVEANILTKHKDSIPYLFTGARIDIDSTPCLVGMGVDITDRKLAEQQLLIAKYEAERANDAKSEFLGRVSHELRTPLNAILGFGQLLNADDKLLDQDQKEAVDHILEAGSHLLYLINELLDIVSIDAKKMRLSIEDVHLGDTKAS